MFYCRICKKSSKKDEKCNFVVVEKRPKEYYETYTKFNRNTKEKTEYTKLVGKGWETIKEIKVCNKCFLEMENNK